MPVADSDFVAQTTDDIDEAAAVIILLLLFFHDACDGFCY